MAVRRARAPRQADDRQRGGAEPGVETVVVTAQRRERESAGRSAVGRDGQRRHAGRDQRRRRRHPRRWPGRVPSLNIESSFGRTFPRFYIRGLGNTDFDLNASQPVSLVYDDVVLENPILKGFPVVRRRPGRSAARAARHVVRPQHAGRVSSSSTRVKPGKRPQLCEAQLRHLAHDQRRRRGRRPAWRQGRGPSVGPVAASQGLDRQSR